MASEWDKIQATFKKRQALIKKVEKLPVDKLVKQVKAALEAAWKAEKKFIKALEAAQESGLKGKKPKAFMGHKEFKDSYAVLSRAAAQNLSAVKVLKANCAEASTLHKELFKLLADIKKHITRGDREQAKFQALVTDAHDTAKAVANATGKLTAPELFYGAQFDRVVDGIINKSKAAGPAGDAAKLIEQKERDKNVKSADKLAQQVAKLCEAAMNKAETDPKAAVPNLKKAAKLIKTIKSYDTAYQNLQKKNAALINKSKDKAKIIKAISSISLSHKVSANRYSDVVNEIRELPA